MTQAVVVQVTDENRDALVDIALSMYLGEACKYCGHVYDALASVVTRQRSGIDTLRAALEDVVDDRDEAVGQIATARALLAELLDETGLKESYTARDGTLHPGATQTVKDVWRFLWGEGRAE